MNNNVVEKIVLVVQSVASREAVERWTFDISQKPKENTCTDNSTIRPLKEIQNEIQSIVRQITASVSFLPALEEPCSFNLLVFADKNATVPSEWIDSDPKYIPGAEQVKLRSFSTGLHKVETLVAYKFDS